MHGVNSSENPDDEEDAIERRINRSLQKCKRRTLREEIKLSVNDLTESQLN
jgi:hypothetical protein